MPAIRVVMPNGTTKSFPEGTPKFMIRQAQTDMLAEMKASGAYDGIDLSELAAGLMPERRKFEAIQYNPGRTAALPRTEIPSLAGTASPRLDRIAPNAPLAAPGRLPGAQRVAIPNPPPPGYGILGRDSGQRSPFLPDSGAMTLPPPIDGSNLSIERIADRPAFKSAYTPERIAAILYNEGASFRGASDELESGFDNMARVIVNRERAGWKDKYGKGGAMANDFLTGAQKAAIAIDPNARAAYNRALEAARRALDDRESDPTNGARYFWHPNLTHPEKTKAPSWAVNQTTSNGPFTSPATDGDDIIDVRTYHGPQLNNRRR